MLYLIVCCFNSFASVCVLVLHQTVYYSEEGTTDGKKQAH